MDHSLELPLLSKQVQGTEASPSINSPAVHETNFGAIKGYFESPIDQLVKIYETDERLLELKLTNNSQKLLVRTQSSIKVLNSSSFAEENKFQGSFSCMEVTKDDKYMITGGEDGITRIWDIEEAVQLKALEGHTSVINCLAITEDGKYCITGGGDGTARIWDIEEGVQIKVLEGHIHGIVCIAITSDGKYCITCGADGIGRIWDIQEGVLFKLLEGHSDRILCLAITDDGNHCITGGEDLTTRIWDIQKGTQEKILDVGYVIHSLAITKDGKYCIMRNPKLAIFWDIEEGSEVKYLDEGHFHHITCKAVTKDGKYCITGSSDMIAVIWDIKKEL